MTLRFPVAVFVPMVVYQDYLLFDQEGGNKDDLLKIILFLVFPYIQRKKKMRRCNGPNEQF